jgi:hypothetical protein
MPVLEVRVLVDVAEVLDRVMLLMVSLNVVALVPLKLVAVAVPLVAVVVSFVVVALVLFSVSLESVKLVTVVVLAVEVELVAVPLVADPLVAVPLIGEALVVVSLLIVSLSPIAMFVSVVLVPLVAAPVVTVVVPLVAVAVVVTSKSSTHQAGGLLIDRTRGGSFPLLKVYPLSLVVKTVSPQSSQVIVSTCWFTTQYPASLLPSQIPLLLKRRSDRVNSISSDHHSSTALKTAGGYVVPVPLVKVFVK